MYLIEKHFVFYNRELETNLKVKEITANLKSYYQPKKQPL